MKEPTQAEREQLAELLWLDPDDPRRKRALSDDPRLAELLAELETAAAAAAGALERARERTVERDAAEPADASLEDAALAALRAEVEPPAEPASAPWPGPSRVPWLWLAATVAAAAVLVLWLRPTDDDGTVPQGAAERVWLGDGVDGSRLEATFAGDRVQAFRWSPAPPPGSVHVVRVWRSAAAEGAPDVESPPRTRPEWIPTADQASAIGPAFTWAVFERSPVTGATRRLFDARVELDAAR